MTSTPLPSEFRPAVIIGCAGWSLPSAQSHRFPDGNSHLERYAQRFNGVEVNSSFYRAHLPATYRRWAATVPANFSFAVKIPRTISHERRLRSVGPELEVFLGQAGELGPKMACLLLQLPPSLAYTPSIALPFFDQLARLHQGPVACEPRHPSWFQLGVARALRDRGVSRVAADPARLPRGAVPAGDERLQYYRLHGSPRIYYDAYPNTVLRMLARRLLRPSQATFQRWCVFDNTALGHAVTNGLDLVEQLAAS